MSNSTQEIDFEQIRAQRAAAILNCTPNDDEAEEDYDEDLCAGCGAPCPVDLCEDCHAAGAHVAGPGSSEPVDERCPCGTPVKDGNPWCSYEHYLEYDLVGEAEDLRAEVERLKESNRGLWFILWGETSILQAEAEARAGKRLQGLLYDDPKVNEAWEVFHATLRSAIRAGIDGGTDR